MLCGPPELHMARPFVVVHLSRAARAGQETCTTISTAAANPSATPAQVQQWIKDNATQDAVTGSFPGVYNTTTPRRFLFSYQ
jgi:hypothetical protein